MGWTDSETGDTEAEIIGGLMEVIVWYEGMPDDVEVDSDRNFIFITKPNGKSLSLLLHQGNLEINRDHRDLNAPPDGGVGWMLEQIDRCLANPTRA